MMKEEEIRKWLSQRCLQLEQDKAGLEALEKEMIENLDGENYHDYMDKLASTKQNIREEEIIITVLEGVLEN